MKVVDLNPILFREYDLRGVVGDIIDEDVAYTLGLNYGSYVLDMGINKVIIGRDNRVSSPSLAKALIEGITQTGCDVLDLGEVTTPMFYYGRYSLKLYAGIMVTASHNPKEYNGFKMSFTDIGNAYGPLIQEFYRYTLNKKYRSGNGKVETYDIKNDYVDYFVSNVDIKGDIKVVVDCGNGAGSLVIKDILDKLNVTYDLLYCTSDGTFPNHSADPSVEKNMEDLKRRVVELGYDVGLGIDGDGDRIGIVTEKGEYIQSDLYLLFMARYLKNNLNENKVLFDVKCSKSLINGLKEIGLTPVMNRTGNSYMNMMMKSGDFSFGGEYSGHVFYRDKWAGFDDGIYAGARFLEMLTNCGVSASELLNSLHKYAHGAYELRAGENGKREVVEKIREYAHNKGYETIELDGVRMEFTNGWALVRFSNTSPNLTVILEADDENALISIEDEILTKVKEYISQVKE